MSRVYCPSQEKFLRISQVVGPMKVGKEPAFKPLGLQYVLIDAGHPAHQTQFDQFN